MPELRNSQLTVDYKAVITAAITAAVGAFVTFAITKVSEMHWIDAALIALVPTIIVLVSLLFATRSDLRLGSQANASDAKAVVDKVAALATPTEVPALPAKPSELEQVLSDIGLTEVSGRLRHSPYAPQACMKRSKRSLKFLGVLGSKWVIEPTTRQEFARFLKRLDPGSVQFCLINPWSGSFKRLKGKRGDDLSWESLKHFAQLMVEHPNLEVRLYEVEPSFRLILIDSENCVVARYKAGREEHEQADYGWEAPHLSFSSKAPWSLYDPFDAYFGEVWSNSKSLSSFEEELKG